MSRALHAQVAALGLEDHVRFLGPMAPDRLPVALSSADLFVLATSYEGWANVFLEAMACGLPVVATRVGGNAGVVSSPALGRLVPFGDASALGAAIAEALRTRWDRAAILAHARANSWDARIPLVLEEWRALSQRERAGAR
jgi:glycosyltransferase involved in cell wall biosynthesis